MISPLVPSNCDLRGFPFMPLDVDRLLDSDFNALATGKEFKAGFSLWCNSWLQVPAGSLPNDDKAIAFLAGVKTGWKAIRPMAMRGWVLCSDGRWYHPVIAEKATRAWEKHHRLRHSALRTTNNKRIKGWRWEKIRQRIFSRDGQICSKCGSTQQLEIDHIRPLADSGGHGDENLRVLCRTCNRSKSYKVDHD